MRGAIEEVFASVLELRVEEGYVKLDNGFVDRTKLESTGTTCPAVPVVIIHHRVDPWKSLSNKCQRSIRLA